MKRPVFFLSTGAVFLALSSLLIFTARRTSLVYDEVIYAPAGIHYWKVGDFRWNPEHPPLQKLTSALPLLAAGVAIPAGLDPAKADGWRMGYRVFFENPSPLKLIFLARIPTIILTLLLGALLFLWVKKQAGAQAALGALAAFAFDPLVIANGALAMNDMFVTFFVFTAALSFHRWTRDPHWRWAILSGALAGAAIASKFSGLLLGPLFLFMLWRARPSDNKKRLVGLAACAAATVFVILACYRFDVAPLMSALRAGGSVHGAEGRDGFLLGPIPGASGWFYYPVATLIKTPAPLLVLWLAALVTFFKKPRFVSPSVLLAPVAIFWAAALLSRNHFGVRYLLPATPFLAVVVGFYCASLKKRSEKLVYWGLLFWLVAGAVIAAPHAMADFNGLVGGAKNGHKWLDGSNQDWGQDLPALASLIEKQNPKPALLMGYWGSNRPEAWGLNYQDVFSPAITNKFRTDTVNPVEAEREWLVVSAELRHNPSTKYVYAWLNDKEPVALLGGTLFVFDVTSDQESTMRLAEIYRMMGREPLYRRQLERAAFIGTTSSKSLHP